MKNRIKMSDQLITEYYEEYRRIVFFYICRRIDDRDDAEDLTQDAFLRLLEYRMMIRRDTLKYFLFTIVRNLVNDYLLKYFLFTIVRNLVNDYLRRLYKKQEIDRYLYEVLPVSVTDLESQVIAKDLRRWEYRKVATLSEQRRKVYVMSRFQSNSISEISQKLNLSFRTVESHLFVSRRDVREFMRACI